VSDIKPGNIGGVERFTASIVEQLKKRKMEVNAYDRGAIEHWSDKWYDKYIVSARLNMHVGTAAWERFSSAENVPDVIIQNSIAGWNLRGKTNIPRIVIHHGSIRGLYYIDLPPDVGWRMKLNRYIGLICFGGGLEQYTAKGAVSVAVSTSVAEELQQYYSGINPVVIPNGIDIEHFAKRDRFSCRGKYGIGEDEFVVCFTGRFGLLGKGFAELHALAVLAWEAQLQIKFLIATNEIPTGWPANVVFVKNVNYENIPEIYSAANVFVFPTRYEGCSYSLLEAMACELPVLTTQVGYAKDLRRDIAEIAPYILKENNVEQYWKLLKQLAGDEFLTKKIGLIGADYVRRHNSLDVMVDAYVKLIDQISKGSLQQ
ncbi:MAG TPA: glycosyltransferase family 4 protein, partial [Negativicutes bacterium]|nr:glycosyltransferase family 4 protein [Negativicutes bacterium]